MHYRTPLLAAASIAVVGFAAIAVTFGAPPPKARAVTPALDVFERELFEDMSTDPFEARALAGFELSSNVSFSLSLPAAPTTQAGLTAGTAACASLYTSLGASKYASLTSNTLSYAASRLYWNTVQDLYTPACAVYPTTAQDVSVAIKAIRAASSRFAIKAGGHNPNTFFSSVENGVLIDLSKMTNKTYDASSGLVTYGPGNRFQDIYSYLQPMGVTVTGARLGGVGSGLGLGGGLSYLSANYGLAVDGFRELTVVLPNGTITTCSSSTNPDLFFAMKGGGGNAYGVVTQYTVAARNMDHNVWAGNLIYLFNETGLVLDAAYNFAKYNTDPKAATITTFNELFYPDLSLNLSQAVILFLVYDGPDPGTVFANFTNIPHLIDTTGQKTYYDATTTMVPLAATISSASNIFRVSTLTLDTMDGIQTAYDAWLKWAEDNKVNGSYVLTSLDVEPVPQSLIDASTAQGGNAMNMSALKGPFIWMNWLVSIDPLLPTAQYNAVLQSFGDAQRSVPNAAGYPLFINDANADQNPLTTFSTYSRLKSIKNSVDPDGYFTQYTGQWAFP